MAQIMAKMEEKGQNPSSEKANGMASKAMAGYIKKKQK